LTAVNGNPQLLGADRRSLFESAMKAAQDGLLPDGRDGALVIFRAKVKEGNRDVWIDKVQWMPMVGGILKKVRNSGDLLTIAAHVVYEKDTFKYSLGDEEKIEHIPSLLDDRGKPAIVYAVAKTKDGGIYREVMSIRDIEKVRNVSRAKDRGPWVDWWDEMAKKTVIRRLAKRLPMSSDLDDLIRRDDDLYDFTGKRADAGEQHGRLFKVVENPLADDAPAQIEGAPRWRV
jgi:recombination protein RecT